MQADPATICPLQEGSVIFRRKAATLKPAMNRDDIEVGVRSERILVDIPTGGPSFEDHGDGMFIAHDRHFMTNTVIL